MNKTQEEMIEKAVKNVMRTSYISAGGVRSMMGAAIRNFIDLSKAEENSSTPTPRRNPAADKTYCEAYEKRHAGEDVIPVEACKRAAKALADCKGESDWGGLSVVPAAEKSKPGIEHSHFCRCGERLNDPGCCVQPATETSLTEERVREQLSN